MFVEQMLPTALERLVTIQGDAPLLQAASLLGGAGADLVVVCDVDKLLVGVITRLDVVRQIGHCQGSGCAIAVSTFMTRTVTLCRPGDQVHDIWAVMKERRLKNIPVVGQDARPIGVLNARDALEVLLEDAEYEERLLRDYVMCVGYQ
jgi:CBS domain-containing protein